MQQTSSNKTHSSERATKAAPRREIVMDEVRFRAYQIYISRNRAPGHELDDWLQAERELLSSN